MSGGLHQIIPTMNDKIRKEHCSFNTKCIRDELKGCKCIHIPVDKYAQYNCAFLALVQVDVMLRDIDAPRNYTIIKKEDIYGKVRYYVDANDVRKKFYNFLIDKLGYKQAKANDLLYDYWGKNTRIIVSTLIPLSKFFMANIFIAFANDPSMPPSLRTGYEYPCTLTLVHDNDKHVNAAIFVPMETVKQKFKHNCEVIGESMSMEEAGIESVAGGYAGPIVPKQWSQLAWFRTKKSWF